MSKNPSAKTATAADLARFCKSTFTVTFAVEVLGIDVWHDCNEGWLDLGPCSQGIKIQYQLYPGQNFDIDILIWPHAAKIWCGGQYGWVRTWQFLEHRFLTFSIRHAFPVRVTELQTFKATITPSIGISCLSANAKSDKNVEVFLPPLQFMEQRYFAPIVEGEESLRDYMTRLIWELVVEYIPPSFLDGLFDVPHAVSDVRHQDAIIYYVREAVLNNNKISEEEVLEEPAKLKLRDRRDSKVEPKIVVKEKEKEKEKFEIRLMGDSILAGTGRIVTFEKFGDKPPDLGEFITIISSQNLPAQDDLPIMFVNVENLSGIPMEAFKKLRISQIYTKWVIGNEEHSCEPQNVRVNKSEVNFNDHHAIPMFPEAVAEIAAVFLDVPFEIQLRGIRTPMPIDNPKFFGYQLGDHDFGTTFSKKIVEEESDILIAVTRIDGRAMAKCVNTFISGEYPLFTPTLSVADLEREGICSNDINLIKSPVCPKLVVPSYVILEAQMNLEASLGFVGCKPKKVINSFSRLYCLIKDTECVMTVLKVITEINEELLQANMTEEALTGFTLDAGSLVVLYVEGPSDGEILRVWEMMADFYPKVKPIFSTSAKYPDRIYSELLKAAMPFFILKMYVPLGVLLACPPVYVRPALPLPTRSAILKLGRLVSGKLRLPPGRWAMPTTAELKSFKLEMCVAAKPIVQLPLQDMQTSAIVPMQSTNLSLMRINWENK